MANELEDTGGWVAYRPAQHVYVILDRFRSAHLEPVGSGFTEASGLKRLILGSVRNRAQQWAPGPVAASPPIPQWPAHRGWTMISAGTITLDPGAY